MKKNFFAISILLFSLVAIPSAQAEVNEELLTILKDACPESRIPKLYKKFSGSIKRISSKARWQTSVKASIYTSCFLGYSTWRTMMAFNLGHVGINEGLQSNTIFFLTSLLSKNAIGKGAYISMGKTYELLIHTGLDHGRVKDILLQGRKNKYRIAALEGLGYLYIELRKNGHTHEAALSDAILFGEKFKKTTNINAIRKRAYEALSMYMAGKQKLAVDFNSAYYSNNRNIFTKAAEKNISLAKAPVNINKLNAFVNQWLNTKYRFGGSTKKGIDSTAFVVKTLADQYPQLNLPKSAPVLASLGQQVATGSLQPGDLLFFSTAPDSNIVTHVGLYLGDGAFAYANSSQGITKRPIDQGIYKRRFIRAQRLIQATQ